MADFYLDHGAYSSSKLGTTPTWGVPQDGDGSSTTVATSASTAQTVFDTQPSPNNTYTICGVIFTAVSSGATGAQFNIGASLDITLNNLATVINSTSTTVAAAVSYCTPKIQNLVYARGPALGAPANTIQFMMRAGSATLNYSNNSNVAIATSGWPGSITHTQFAGGSGGCLGYAANDSTIGTLGISNNLGKFTYGAFIKPLITYTNRAPIEADICYVRTGNNPVITMNSADSSNMTGIVFPTFVFDSNLVWTSDSDTGLFLMDIEVYSTANLIWAGPSVLGALGLQCTRRYNLKISIRSTSYSTRTFTIGSSSYTKLDGVWLLDQATVTSLYHVGIANTASASQTIIYKDCKYESTYPLSTWVAGLNLVHNSSGYPGYFEIINSEFIYNYTGSATPSGFISPGFSGGINTLLVHNCTISAGGKLMPLLTSSAGTVGTLEIECYNNNGISLSTTTGSIQSTGTAGNMPDLRVVKTAATNGAWRFENIVSWADWIPDASPPYPTLSTVMPDGSTHWSMCIAWPSGSSMSIFTPFLPPPISSWYRDSSSVRNIEIELMAPTGISISDSNLKIMISYQTPLGVTIHDEINGSDMVSSTETWTNSRAGYSAYKFVITTSNQIKQNSLVSAQFHLSKPSPTGSLCYLFIDPEFSIV